MKKLLLLLACAFFIQFWPGSAAYAGWTWGPHNDAGGLVNGYHRNFGSEEKPRASLHLCGPAIGRLMIKDMWVADVFSPCGGAATTIAGEADPTGTIGARAFNLLGLSVIFDYSFLEEEPVASRFGVAFSLDLIGVKNQFIKNEATADVVK